MLMTKPRSNPSTPVRVRSPHSITMTASPGSSIASGDLDRRDAGERAIGGGGGVAVDDAHVLADAAQREGHRELRADGVAVGSHVRADSTKRCRCRISSAISRAHRRRRQSTSGGSDRIGIDSARCAAFFACRSRRICSMRSWWPIDSSNRNSSSGTRRRRRRSGHLPAEERRGARRALARCPVARLGIAEAGVEDARDLQVGGDLHARQRDEADAGIVHLAAASISLSSSRIWSPTRMGRYPCTTR